MKLYMPEKPKEVPEMKEKNQENNLGKNSFDDFEMLDYNEEIKKLERQDSFTSNLINDDESMLEGDNKNIADEYVIV